MRLTWADVAIFASQPPKINIAGRALMSWFTCSNRSKLNCVCHPPAGRFKGWHLASLTPQGTIVIVREFMSSRSHSSISDEWYDDGERAHPQPPGPRPAEENKTCCLRSGDLISCISGSALTFHPFLVCGLFSPTGEESRRATYTAVAPEYLHADKIYENTWWF
jgi:hypothetical protein